MRLDAHRRMLSAAVVDPYGSEIRRLRFGRLFKCLSVTRNSEEGILDMEHAEPVWKHPVQPLEHETCPIRPPPALTEGCSVYTVGKVRQMGISRLVQFEIELQASRRRDGCTAHVVRLAM